MAKKLLFIFISLLALSGCSFKPVQLPSVHTYAINTSSEQRFSHHPNLVSIQVMQPTATSYYVSTNMYYQLKPHSLQAFTLNRWLAPPTQMLLPLVTQSLINSNYYHAVIAAPANAITHYRLDTRIINLYQDFTANPSQMVVTIQATLINNQTGVIVASKEFRQIAIVTNNDPYGGVLAANLAMQKILAQIVEFCLHNS